MLRGSLPLLAFGLILTFFSSFGQTFLLSLSVPAIESLLGISNTVFGSLYAVATLSSAFTLPWLGGRFDRMPIRRYTLMVLLGLIAGLLLLSSARHIIVVGIAFYGLRLFGQGLMSHTAISAMARYFEANRGKAIGTATLGHPIGEAPGSRCHTCYCEWLAAVKRVGMGNLCGLIQQSMRAKLKIGLIGLGIWGEKIARDLVKIGAELHVCDTSPNRRQLAFEMGAVAFSTDIFSLRSLDGLVIVSPTTTHYSILKQVLPWHIPVFVEKPVVASLEEAKALSPLVHDEVFVMHIWKYHRGIQVLGQIAQSQELGPVLGLRSTRANWTSPRRDVDSVWNLMPHDLSILIAIFGYLPEPEFAVVEQHPDMVRGMYAVLGKAPWAIIEVSNRYERKSREVRLHCQYGVAILKDEKADHLEIYRGDEHAEAREMKKEIRKFNPLPPLYAELEVFCSYISGEGEPPLSNYEEGLAVIQCIHQLNTIACP